MMAATETNSATLFGLSLLQVAMIAWTVLVAGAVIFVVYVVFFLDNIRKRGSRLSTRKVGG